MDIEFHYYITYLVALEAGFAQEEAEIIAASSQMVDDNTEINYIENHAGEIYKTYISQTANILKPDDELFRIYPIFHFVPGEYMNSSTFRKDGIMHVLNTTPNSKKAQNLMNLALDSKNLYRIGIAAHTYSDTWAHQNFIGYYSYFNSLQGVLEKAIPNIGHADARHKPDLVSLIWKDERLISKNEIVDNNQRFLEATACLLKYFLRYTEKKIINRDLFLETINSIFSLAGCSYYHKQKRKDMYNKFSCRLSGKQIPKYDQFSWFREAVAIQNNDSMFLPNLNYDRTKYVWKEKNYKKSNYYCFIEAVKKHQRVVGKIFETDKYSQLELDRW